VRERCLAQGADQVITKPFEPAMLAGAIHDALSARTA
jgi:CheY-like chemotaxis protein